MLIFNILCFFSIFIILGVFLFVLRQHVFLFFLHYIDWVGKIRNYFLILANYRNYALVCLLNFGILVNYFWQIFVDKNTVCLIFFAKSANQRVYFLKQLNFILVKFKPQLFSLLLVFLLVGELVNWLNFLFGNIHEGFKGNLLIIDSGLG